MGFEDSIGSGCGLHVWLQCAVGLGCVEGGYRHDGEFQFVNGGWGAWGVNQHGMEPVEWVYLPVDSVGIVAVLGGAESLVVIFGVACSNLAGAAK